jgi:hypothetical protein
MSCNGSYLRIFVLCSSQESAASWNKRKNQHVGVDILPIFPVSQAWQRVRELVAQYSTPVVVCQEYVWFGVEFSLAVSSLIVDLNRQYPGWGACSNRGCTWEGTATCDYTCFTQNEGGGLETALRPRPVISVDDNLVLLNCSVLGNHELMDLRNVQSGIFGIPLSLECLRNRVPLLVDPRLFTVRTEQHSVASISKLISTAEFKAYYRANFLNHRFPWPDAPVDLSNCVDYDYVTHPGKTCVQADILDLFDGSLSAMGNRQASITLCCRTQFGRMELLRRAMSSFMVLYVDTSGLLDLHVRLISDADEARSTPQIRALREEFPSLRFEYWPHTIREPRFSRTDLLLGAIERADTDYIWFVDDDDYVLPSAALALARTLVPGDQTVVVGHSLKIEEAWDTPEGATGPFLMRSKKVTRFENRNLFRVFAGANHIPICSMLLPVKKVLNCLAGKRALGNYNEDYFVLLSTLTAPKTDLRLLDADICAVSFRGAVNTVNETDRSAWHHSYATFMQEILSGDNTNPMIWQVGKRLPVC